MLDPDDGYPCCAGPVHQRADVGHHCVPLVCLGHDAVLHIKHHEGSVGPVRQRGHDGLGVVKMSSFAGGLVESSLGAGSAVVNTPDMDPPIAGGGGWRNNGSQRAFSADRTKRMT